MGECNSMTMGRQMGTQLLGYARTGKDLDVMAELDSMGVGHWRGIRVDFVRKGKQRTPEPVEAAALPNYIWLWPERDQIHLLRDVKHLAHSFHFLSDGSTRAFSAFAKDVDARKAEADRIVGNRAAICEYRQGERIEIRDGALAGQIATFRRMVERTFDLHPHIVADLEMFGALVPIELDPLSVRRAAE